MFLKLRPEPIILCYSSYGLFHSTDDKERPEDVEIQKRPTVKVDKEDISK